MSWFILKSFNSSRKNVSFTLRFQIKIWGVTRFQSCNMVPWIFSHFPKMERYSGIEFSWIFDDMMRAEWCKCAERLVNYRQIKDKRNLLNVKIQFAEIRRIKRHLLFFPNRKGRKWAFLVLLRILWHRLKFVKCMARSSDIFFCSIFFLHLL